MRNKKLNKQLFFSIFFFLLFIGAVVVNEMDLLKKYTSVPVVMALDAIDKDTTITEDMIYVYEMPREFVLSTMFQNPEDVVGKTATQLIMPNQYVSPFALDASILRPTKDHEFFPIPDEWLVDIQGTLRRYDTINISAIYDMKNKDEEVDMSQSLQKIKKEKVLEEVPVVYVKGGKNDEVTGVVVTDDRLNGTGSPSSIQLSLTLEEFKTLEENVMQGYRFVLSH